MYYTTLVEDKFAYLSYISVCQNVEAGTEPGSPPMRMIAVTYVYMINKYIELLDTIFMVFKKKNNQVRVYSGNKIRCF